MGLVEEFDRKAKERQEEEKRNKEKKDTKPKTTTTSFYTTTPYYILQSWGCFQPELKLHVEQITKSLFLYNYKNKFGLVQTQSDKNSETKKWEFWLNIENEKFFFKKPILSAEKHYNIPTTNTIRAFLDGKFKPRSFKEIIEEVGKKLSIFYEFMFQEDLTVWKLHIGQSYLKHILSAFFFVGIDASFGGGKTTLLELASLFKYHGFLGGDISPASIPRLVDELSLNVGIDEFDQKIGGDENITAILRKGQRKGNPYVRCEGKDHTPTSYEVAGAHDYSYRTETEDAFGSRSLKTHTGKAKDKTLPILNLYKNELLKPLADELFLWGIQNSLNLYGKYQNNVVACSNVEGCSSGLSTQEFRNSMYNKLTCHLGSRELNVLQKLSGRNIELAFICLNVAKLLDFDVVEELSTIMQQKAKTESISENFYLDKLEEFLSDLSAKCDVPKLQDGINATCRYYPKNQAFQEFVKDLSEMRVATIGTRKFTSLLREIGFIEGQSITSQRFDGKPPKHCLIFTKEILDKLNPPREKPKDVLEIEEETVA